MTTKLIEFDKVLNNFGGDSDLLKDTVALSLKYLPLHMEKVRHAVAQKNPKDIEISAHTIKGSLSIYLNKPIVQAAYDLEKLGKAGQLDQTQALLDELESQLKALTQELEAFSKNP